MICQDGGVDAGPPCADWWPSGSCGQRGADAGHRALARQTPGPLPAPDGGWNISGNIITLSQSVMEISIDNFIY